MNKIRLALYRSPPCPNAVDWMIGRFSWSNYYHASIVFPDGTEWQSKPGRGVCKGKPLGWLAEPGSRCELYEFIQPITEDDLQQITAFLIEEEGSGYDYKGILGFLLRWRSQSTDKWFCSELVFSACLAAGRRLLNNREPWQISPVDLTESPLLYQSGTYTVPTPLKLDIPLKMA
jgi:hypothetical protein